MSTKNPFRLAVQQANAEPEEDDGGEISNPFRRAVEAVQGVQAPVNITPRPAIDIGVGGAFGSGVVRGFTEPLRFVGLQPDKDPRIDSPTEQVAHALGSLAGLGIGFVPITAGTGFVLRGAGIVAGETVASKASYSFLRNTIAGTVQFAGASEKLEDLPKNIVLGAGFGAAMEGIFFARALRGRGSKAGGVGDDFIDTGSSVPDKPVSANVLDQERAIAPVDGKSPERLVDELAAMSNPDKATEEILADLTGVYENTLYFRGVDNAEEIIRYAQDNLGDNVQVLRRRIFGGQTEDVLIHNPLSEDDLLSPNQIKQWTDTGFYEGMGVLYKGKTYMATGGKAAKGRVQLSDPSRPGLVFAPRISEVTRPLYGTNFFGNATRQAQLAEIAQAAELRMGVVVPTQGGRARRGVVDTEEFVEISSLEDFFRQNREELLSYEAPSVREAIARYAEDRRIPGFVQRDEGFVTRVHVFDQSRVSYQQEVPRVGLTIDDVSLLQTPDDQTILQSFTPSWRNRIMGVMREQGISEKEAKNFLELYRRQQGRTISNLVDDEVQAVARQTDLQIPDGCI